MTVVDAAAQLPDLGTVLAVFAHPDDETYLAGGLLAAAAQRGDRIVVATATAGERGTDDPDDWPPSRLRATRTWEIAAAMAALGVVDHRLLGLADGSLDALALADGAGMIADLIADVCPDTVVTFGDDGVTGHPDHCAVARWVSSALAGERERPHVLAAALESGYCDRFDRLHRDLSVFMAPGYPRAVDRSDLQLHLELSGVWLDQKVAALRCQSTQTASVERAMGAATFREWVSVESFVDVTDRRPPSAVVRAGLAGSDGG